MRSFSLYCSFAFFLSFLYFANIVYAGIGEDIADKITARYNKTGNGYNSLKDNCGTHKPAFMCTGVILRGTKPIPNGQPWDPNEQSINDKGISLSYLRADSNFSRLAKTYNNGFIFYPPMDAPAGKMQIDYLCAFPFDGATDGRTPNCGQHGNNTYSQPCQDGPYRILTGEQWRDYFMQGHFGDGYQGCGFGVRQGTDPGGNGISHGFAAAVKARYLLGDRIVTTPNEIVATTWDLGSGASLPIEAFFYVHGDGIEPGGDVQAMQNQINYYQMYNIWIPVISIRLPQTSSGKATFHYHPSDQKVAPH